MDDESNEWAKGCEKCKYGIVDAPPRTGVVELYLERLTQLINGDLTLCDCRAGLAYRANLMNQRQKLIEEARRKPMLAQFAQMDSHPFIEQSQQAIANEYSKVPPIRWDGATGETAAEPEQSAVPAQ